MRTIEKAKFISRPLGDLRQVDTSLRDTQRTESKKSTRKLPSIVSLFSGAGGLDLGFKQAGYSISVAIDLASAAISSHKHNFPDTLAEVGDLIKLQPQGVLEIVSRKLPKGSAIAVIGGPPCQGFSRANNGAKSTDPRNKLPQLYLEIVALLQEHYAVEFIVFENVLGIRDRKHLPTFLALKEGVAKLGFSVSEQELCAEDFGVAQTRRRIILAGLSKDGSISRFKPRKRSGDRTVKEAIGHLPEPQFFCRNLDPNSFPAHPNHWTMQPKSARFSNPDAEVDDGRSFKRLKWEKPSPTIAFGNREIHVHPSGKRRLSILEAMLLQGFPKEFVLLGNLSEQVQQISNAVPPPLAKSIANAMKLAFEGPSRE